MSTLPKPRLRLQLLGPNRHHQHRGGWPSFLAGVLLATAAMALLNYLERK